MGRKRLGLLTLIGALSAPILIAGMAWACGPSGYGVPEQPAAPPVSTAQPVQTPTQGVPSQSAPVPVTPSVRPTPNASAGSPERGSVTTRGVDSGNGGGSGGSGGSGDSGSGGSGSIQPSGQSGGGPNGQAAIDARVAGATAGVVERGEQRVFRSSTAARNGQEGSGAVAATEDLWSASPSGSGSSSLATAAQADDGGGLSGGVLAGIIVLSLGLVGITAGVLVAEVRRRRAEGLDR